MIKIKNLIYAVLFWVYTSNSIWSKLILEEAGAAGDITTKYGTSTTITITLASLASSATWVAGRESTAVTIADPATDHIVSGKITVGTTPAGGQIQVWVYTQYNDTPTYPDVLDGTDSAETITSVSVKNSGLYPAATIFAETTTDRTYWVKPFSIKEVCGYLPQRYGLFIAQSTTVNLNATGSNHEFKYTPIYENVSQS
jgi:hypothetical protein